MYAVKIGSFAVLSAEANLESAPDNGFFFPALIRFLPAAYSWSKNIQGRAGHGVFLINMVCNQALNTHKNHIYGGYTQNGTKSSVCGDCSA